MLLPGRPWPPRAGGAVPCEIRETLAAMGASFEGVHRCDWLKQFADKMLRLSETGKAVFGFFDHSGQGQIELVCTGVTGFHMVCQRRLMAIASIANRADIRFFPGMRSHVFLKVVCAPETLVACGADKRLFTGMGAHVAFESICVGEAYAACIAAITLLSGVDAHMRG